MAEDIRTSRVTDGANKQLEQFNLTSEKLARMLVVFQKLMQSSHVFNALFQLGSASFAHCQTLTKRLFKLMKVDNFLMTNLAAQSIVSIMQFPDESESATEEKNKKRMLESIGMIKYLGRHLSFHDRYIKMEKRNKLYCHMSLKMVADLLKAFFCNRQAPRINYMGNHRFLFSDQ